MPTTSAKTSPSTSDDVALGGRAGATAAKLLRESVDAGSHVLYLVARQGLRDMLRSDNPFAVERIFSPASTQRLTRSLAATNASAELLGMSDVWQQHVDAVRRHKLAVFEEASASKPVPLLSPWRAVQYFKSLIPSLTMEPRSFEHRHERQAFTLAVATEQIVLEKMKAKLAQFLEQGEVERGPGNRIRPGKEVVDEVLDACGVGERRKQYGDMVFRTNMMDSYNTGATREMQDPVVAKTFPVWKYLGILDGRQGKDHEIRFGKYYPNELPFATVRGSRVWNCRCGQKPVNKWAWADLYAKGVRVSGLAA